MIATAALVLLIALACVAAWIGAGRLDSRDDELNDRRLNGDERW